MQPEEIIRSVKDIYTHNAFMQHCGIKVHSIICGKASSRPAHRPCHPHKPQRQAARRLAYNTGG